MPRFNSLSSTIGAGRDALHVSFRFVTKSAKAKHGTFQCTVICERWKSSANKAGRVRPSTGITAEAKYVDMVNNRISDKAKNASEVRAALEAIKDRLRNVYEDYLHFRTDENEPLDIGLVQRTVRDKRVQTLDSGLFVIVRTSGDARGKEYGGVIGRFLDEYRTSAGKKISDSQTNKGNICTMAFHLNRFSTKYYRGRMTVDDLTNPSRVSIVAQRLKQYLIENPDHPLVDPSVENVFKRLRTVLGWAARAGMVRKLDLTHYRYSARKQPKVTLTMEEFRAVAQHKFADDQDRLERVRDLWVFHCVTALRYKDVQALSPLDPEQAMFGVDTHKTKARVNIPMFNITRSLIEKYPKGLPKLSNPKLNKRLKEALEVIGLTREIDVPISRGGKESVRRSRLCDEISSHTGRRQFITIAKELNLHPSMIQGVTGHRNLDELLTYTHHPGEALVKHFQPMNEALGILSL